MLRNKSQKRWFRGSEIKDGWGISLQPQFNWGAKCGA